MIHYYAATTSLLAMMSLRGEKSSAGELPRSIWWVNLRTGLWLNAYVLQDSTLTKAKSNARYPKDGADWDWLYPEIPGRLKQLDAEGAQLVVLSNQGGITLSSSKSDKAPSKSLKPDLKRLTDFKTRLTAILSQLDVPISVYAATARDQYRKPRPGMWKEMLEHYDLDDAESFDHENSLYVGDAGGRTAGGGSGNSDKDFASSDRDLASNADVSFRTPEEFFLNEQPRAFQRSFDPHSYLDESRSAPPFVRMQELDLIVFCGSPGAGKSTYFWQKLQPLGYERVNQDILKSRDKCLKVAREYLQEGKSVAVDNTNADPETRKHWIELSKQLKIPVRCLLFTADLKLCEHNEAVRIMNGKLHNPEGRTALPKIALISFPKRFQRPSLREGFQDITVVDFSFSGTPEQRAVWSQYHI